MFDTHISGLVVELGELGLIVNRDILSVIDLDVVTDDLAGDRARL